MRKLTYLQGYSYNEDNDEITDTIRVKEWNQTHNFFEDYKDAVEYAISILEKKIEAHRERLAMEPGQGSFCFYGEMKEGTRERG